MFFPGESEPVIAFSRMAALGGAISQSPDGKGGFQPPRRQGRKAISNRPFFIVPSNRTRRGWGVGCGSERSASAMLFLFPKRNRCQLN